MVKVRKLNIVTGDTYEDGCWHKASKKLTPVEQKCDGMYYKRDDKFAPLGINSINGTKLRQLIHIFEKNKDKKYVVHATNVNSSPQTPMTAAVAEKYGIKCIQVAGGSNYKSICKKDLPLFASLFGVEYDLSVKSGFNVVIQKRVNEIISTLDDSFKVERDITFEHKLEHNDDQTIYDFHLLTSKQVVNIPEHIEDLAITFGSANSSTSILYGIAKNKGNIKRIHLLNVGVNKLDWMHERLEIMGLRRDELPFDVIYYDTGYKYQQTVKGVYVDDITFHYRYEAKAITYMRQNLPHLIKDTTCFWVVGSVPCPEVTAININKELPNKIKLYNE